MSVFPARTARRPTYADVEALPEGLNGEILGGELVVSPRPAGAHAHTSTVLVALLVSAFQLGRGGPGGWWFQHEPELSLDVDPDFDPVIPDLAGWLRSTLPTPTNATQHTCAPDWICEIISPSMARRDRELKLPFYLRAGVTHVWLVDPVAHTIEVFAAMDDAWTLAAVVAGAGEVSLAPFRVLTLLLKDLWLPEADPTD